MSSSIAIRPALQSDLPEILRLVRGLARFEKLEDQFVATAADFEKALFGKTRSAEIWLGELDGKAIGYVTLFQTFSTFLGKPGLYLEDLYIEEEYRGQGFGSQLFEFVVRLAQERDCGRLEWSALDWNEPAITFYKARGARMLDDWRLFRLDGAALEKF